MTTKHEIREVTVQLLRKRSEHNDHILHNLEELALHQENLTSIGRVLSRICGKTLKILLLPNNVISSLGSDLKQCVALEYLNLALNNVRQISGLERCENLKKLDLTLNFIPLRHLSNTLEILSALENLRELYLLGNPCAEITKYDWKNKYYRLFIIVRVPQLESLDGIEIKKSDRIAAEQNVELVDKVVQNLLQDEQECASHTTTNDVDNPTISNRNSSNRTELTEHTPEVRAELSNEHARQLAEKEANERKNHPQFKGEDDYLEDQELAVKAARAQDSSIRGDEVVKMKNEGRWLFRFDEESEAGYVLLHVDIQKHLSTSLIDVDIHPKHVTIIIKSKTLRLRLPAEVVVSNSKAERSSITGSLLLRMPKVDPNENMIGILAARRATATKSNMNDSSTSTLPNKKSKEKKNSPAHTSGTFSAMLNEVNHQSKAVKIHGLVDKSLNVGIDEQHFPTLIGTSDNHSCPPPIF